MPAIGLAAKPSIPRHGVFLISGATIIDGLGNDGALTTLGQLTLSRHTLSLLILTLRSILLFAVSVCDVASQKDVSIWRALREGVNINSFIKGVAMENLPEPLQASNDPCIESSRYESCSLKILQPIPLAPADLAAFGYL